MSEREEPLILSIETATRAGSVAVSRRQSLVSFRTGDASRSHSTDLLEHIASALAEAGHTLQDVDVFAVALGPGSFTGLRIGVATAKAFASTLERPVVGVPTLDAVALSAGPSTHTLALLPAGRGEVFAQSFRVERDTEVLALDEPSHVAPADLLERSRQLRYIKWAGEGAHLYRELIKERALAEKIAFTDEHENVARTDDAVWALAPPVESLAAYVGTLAFEKYRRHEAVRAEDLHAVYVRLSDAELKEKCRT